MKIIKLKFSLLITGFFLIIFPFSVNSQENINNKYEEEYKLKLSSYDLKPKKFSINSNIGYRGGNFGYDIGKNVKIIDQTRMGSKSVDKFYDGTLSRLTYDRNSIIYDITFEWLPTGERHKISLNLKSSLSASGDATNEDYSFRLNSSESNKSLNFYDLGSRNKYEKSKSDYKYSEASGQYIYMLDINSGLDPYIGFKLSKADESSRFLTDGKLILDENTPNQRIGSTTNGDQNNSRTTLDVNKKELSFLVGFIFQMNNRLKFSTEAGFGISDVELLDTHPLRDSVSQFDLEPGLNTSMNLEAEYQTSLFEDSVYLFAEASSSFSRLEGLSTTKEFELELFEIDSNYSDYSYDFVAGLKFKFGKVRR